MSVIAVVPMIVLVVPRSIRHAARCADVLREAVRHVGIVPMQDGRIEIVIAGHVRHRAPGLRCALVHAAVGNSMHGVRFHALVLA